MNYNLTEEEVNELLSKDHLSFEVVKNWELQKKTYFNGWSEKEHYVVEPVDPIRYCFCKDAKGLPQTTVYCHHCGRKLSTYKLSSREVLEKAEKLASDFNEDVNNKITYTFASPPQAKTKKSIERMYYVKIHPENEEGLLIYKLKPYVQLNDDSSFIKDAGVESILEVLPGQKTRAFVFKRKKEVETEISEFLRLNRVLISKGFPVYYKGADNLVDFMLKNPQMAKMTGLLDCFNKSEANLPRSTFFLFYIVLYAQYPVVELLVKMGQVSIISKILMEFKKSTNSNALKNSMNDLSRLINPNTTKGKAALRIPAYIAEYLDRMNSSIEHYLAWADMYELSENLSKEVFEKIQHEDAFFELMDYDWPWSHTVTQIPLVMKYGYSMQDIITYYKKQGRSLASRFLSALEDYNNMCDIMQVKPDKFPANLEKAHDNLFETYEAYKQQHNSKTIGKIASACVDVVEQANKKAPQGMFIKMPESATDIVNEGQQMHNCVGTYIDKVANFETLIFFIRKKEEPDKSYITAEYRYGHLQQIYFRNNVPVYDKELRGFGQEFVNILNKKGMKDLKSAFTVKSKKTLNQNQLNALA